MAAPGPTWNATLRERLERIRLVLDQFAPSSIERNVRTYLQPLSQRADHAREELLQRMREGLVRRRHRLELASRELSSSSPLSILGRGYALVTHERTGAVLSSAQGVERGDFLTIRLARGHIRASVEETHAGEKQ